MNQDIGRSQRQEELGWGVKLTLTGGHNSLLAALKGPDVTLGLYKRYNLDNYKRKDKQLNSLD